MGRNTLSWREKFEYDVYYVENLSFWLDLKNISVNYMENSEKRRGNTKRPSNNGEV